MSSFNVEGTIAKIAANEKWIVVAVQTPSKILHYNANTFELIREYLMNSEAPINDIKIKTTTNNDNDLLYALWGGELYEWDLTTGNVGDTYEFDSKCIALHVPYDLYQPRNASFICTYHENGEVILWDDKRGDLVRSVNLENVRAICSYGETIYIASENGVYEIDEYSHDIIQHIESNVKMMYQDDNRIWIQTVDILDGWNLKLFIANKKVESYKYSLPINQTFYPHDGYLFYGRRKLKKVNIHGAIVRTYPRVNDNIISIFAYGPHIFIATESKIYKESTHIMEEDSQLPHSTTLMQHADFDIQATLDQASQSERCKNQNVLTLEPYTDMDDPIFIYIPNTNNQYFHAVCTTIDELYQHISSDRNPTDEFGFQYPNNIMTIYTPSNTENNVNGHGTQPTGQIIVKLPVNNIYVTYNSARELLHSHHRVWIAFNLYGVRRRIGNIYGHTGMSRNHGQIPGENIYKLVPLTNDSFNKVYSYEENDYPEFFVEHSMPLLTLIGNERFGAAFINMLVDHLVL
jgi:hypothetical protein